MVGSHGTLTLNTNGSYSYAVICVDSAVEALNAGQSISDVFNYTVSDGSKTANATVTITIFGSDDEPVAQADTNWALADGAGASGNVLQTLVHNGAPDSAARADVADNAVDNESLAG